MKPDYGRCDLCRKGTFEFLEKKVVAGSNYDMVRCNKCHHEVAKRVE